MIIAEPVQNAGGSIVPPQGYWAGLREICDRHGILLCADEVICAFGRIGHWFGAERFGYVPDLITFAKGLTGAHFAMGGVLISDRVAAPFFDGRSNYLHGFTFGGHPVGAAVALASLETIEHEGVIENVRANEPVAAAALDGLRDIPIVGDVRGAGHFWAIELVRDQEQRTRLRRPGRGMAAQGRPLGGALEPRPDLPARRSRRTGGPDRAAPGRLGRADRGDRRDPPGGARDRDRTDGRAARARRRRA